MTRPQQNPVASGMGWEPRIFRSAGERLNHQGNEAARRGGGEADERGWTNVHEGSEAHSTVSVHGVLIAHTENHIAIGCPVALTTIKSDHTHTTQAPVHTASRVEWLGGRTTVGSWK